MLKKLFTKSKTNHTVIVRTDLGHVRILPVYSDKDGILETATAMFPKAEAKTYHDEMTGGLVYMFDLENDGFAEAQTIKNLSTSVALRNIFGFDTKKGSVEFKSMLPYIITIIALLCR
ncbi:hypothetical protein [Brevibacillus laterosporus]|uniref:hypothetical protein n=1 Tax=Brevibacillus laterosporus TaxID=1465 RepID=UPI003D1968B7